MNVTIHNQSGVFVPMQVLQHPVLNPASVCTWMQLRLLVGGRSESAPVSFAELETYTDKSRSALYTHMTALRRAELLDWRFAARRMLVFSLPKDLVCEKLDQETGLHPGNQDQSNIADPLSGLQSKKLDQKTGIESRKLDSTPENWKTPPTSVQKTGADSENLESSPEIWNPPRKTGVNSEKPESSPENRNPALSLKPLINNNNLNINQEEVLREAQFQKTGLDSENLEKEAVKAYHATLGLRPNKAQRAAIAEYVKDLELWQATLDHWQMHGWNPKNVIGILEIYARAGPKGCRFCQKDKPATGLAALALMRQEYADGKRG
jgi:hypothetical protein